MKKLFLSLLLSLFVFAVQAEAISNYKELVAFAKAANKGESIAAWQNEKGIVCLDADIDMKKGKKFPTIKKFTGRFDGCGHKLYNWQARGALFHEITPGSYIRNLTIDESCSLTISTKANEEVVHIGFFVNINRGRIYNCHNKANIDITTVGAIKNFFIGGVAGNNHFIIYRSTNSGNITMRTSATTHGKKAIYARIGGIAGANMGKLSTGATIARCVNMGGVTYLGEFAAINIAGIVGESSKATTKYCVNKGNVVAVTQPLPANIKRSKTVYAGGITAWANNDIICCDNFGQILVSGTHTPNVAGICANANAGMNINDCTNYGLVKVNEDSAAWVGGIVAGVRKNVHIAGCINHGDIVYEYKSTRPARIGGIAANIVTAKTAKFGAFVRNCANYGKIINNSSWKNSCTGGVVGCSSGYYNKKTGKTVKPAVVSCANFGEVQSAGGYKKSVVAYSKHSDERGEYFNDWAEKAEPRADGKNLYGRITDTNGNPVAGVVVSDGTQSVKSDPNGYYAMKSNLNNARFVQISIPSGYEIPTVGNRPQFFRRIPRFSTGAKANFVLTKRANPTDEFVLAMIGDPQTRGLGYDNSTERFRDVLLPDIATYKSSTDKEVYAINLGDLVYNWMTGYDDYVDALATAATPMFSVIGNHDQDQHNLMESHLATPYFETYLAPVNYSFNIGKMHFIAVNNIHYGRATSKNHYKTGLENYTYKWLENDLKHVSPETTIVFCGHDQIFSGRSNNFSTKKVNYKKYSKLLSKYNKVYAWAGHLHQNHSYDYATASEKYKHLKNIETITVARCIGQLRLNHELNVDGTPNGYMVAEVKGDTMEWYYKTVGRDRSYQMRTYSPARTGDGYVKANIWNHSSSTWSNPEWWENGVKVADMEVAKGEADPDYMKIYESLADVKLSATARKYSRPSKKIPFLFRVKPSEGARSGEIRVTDQFGVTYSEKVEW
ncbi:MAG: calcineurin-like phosphoesterase C-terminal domain-containing protein [Alistipes sp.]|nr:calcineurin-like phosphoesterase C-terminal domain-containing protein [Alistipes sp.]